MFEAQRRKTSDITLVTKVPLARVRSWALADAPSISTERGVCPRGHPQSSSSIGCFSGSIRSCKTRQTRSRESGCTR